MDRTSWRNCILQIYNLFPRQVFVFIIIYAVVTVQFVAVIIILSEKIVSVIIISYLRFILVSVRVLWSILIAGFLMRILFELCFPIL